ncbi:glycosyltransferase family 4 protein [Mucilaginibacter daejeonensis]|uniref:glycosyltransferase family 4 protein n=1 Tax=Mucilaginibacter daejeonensis TaxID=398049 RepID=UPI001D179F95|nr:glycosyltransferase family 1 protein [Mucilaginibacter daejeonensis]UEG54952.1 glycosyltransferase family 4 protein [Mucilaginibacter daejeonensis]
MKVLFIGLSNNDKVRGVEQYCINIVKFLAKNQDLQIDLLCGQWQRNYYDQLAAANVNILCAPCGRSKLKRHFFLIKSVKQLSNSYDLVHYCNTLPVFRKNAVPTVITIHDIAEYKIRQKYTLIQRLYRKLVTKLSSSIADKIITVSNFSKDEIVNALHIAPDKIKVIYNGINHLPFQFNYNTKVDFNNKKYILYFGVLEQTKGIPELIKAYEQIADQIIDYNLIFIGKKGNEFEFLQQHLSDKINYLGFLDYDDLYAHLHYASCMVFASKYEGFGFPILEAFIFNDNIITSNTNSLGEIGKDFAICINPESVDELSDAILQTIKFPKSFKTEEKAVILNKYRWENAAYLTYQSYRELIKNL